MNQDTDKVAQGLADEETQAYFDGELVGEARDRFENSIDQKSDRRRTLEELQCLREWIVEGIDIQARNVSEARFEQIWNQFDRVQSRETRLREAVQGKSWWQRVWSPIRLPRWAAWSAIAGGVVGLAVYVVDIRGISDQIGSSSNRISDRSGIVASENSEGSPASGAPPQLDPTEVDSEKLPIGLDWKGSAEELVANEVNTMDTIERGEAPAEAEIEQIEFGGNVGHISRIESSRGTTTVIWITEDDKTVDGEREL